MLIPGYPEGSDITILDTIYVRPRKNEETDKWEDDKLIVLFKDNITGKKDHYVVSNPEYEFYIANDDVYLNPDANLFFIEKDKVHKVTAPYRDVEKKIAEETDNLDFYYNNLKTGNKFANKQLHILPNVFNSDMDIEDHIRYLFDKTYTNKWIPITKSYFDIEVDTIKMRGDFPELGECPINAISYICDKNKTISVFLLRNPNNPLLEEFEKSINDDLFKELYDFITNTVGGIKQMEKYKLVDFGFQFLFFDEEEQLLQSFFNHVNHDQNDFILAWNMAFDIPYIIERLKVLGIDPASVICPKDAEYKIAEYFIDERHKNEYELRGDKYTITSNTVFLDQLIHFASRRKGQHAFPNYKLDTAGEIVAKVRKLDYSHITTNISELPYLDYKTFVFYNIIDTIVQKCIEEKTQDINYIFNKCLINNTRYDKGHRQTIYLTNRATKEFYKDGFIIGNNANKNNPSTKYEGALVNNPLHNSDYAKIKQGEQVLNLCNNLDDFDYKSLYPSIDRENNMAPNTQYGKVIIKDKIHDYENMSPSEDKEIKYSRGGQFIDDLITGDVLAFCERWLGFMDYKTWLKYLMNYVSKMYTVNPMVTIVDDMYVNPLMHTSCESSIHNAIYPVNDFEVNPLSYYSAKIDVSPYLKAINKY